MLASDLRFHNQKFKIMQIADVQELSRVSPDTLRLLTTALEKERPDLAVFTGDQIYGIVPCFHYGNVSEKVKNTLDTILAPLNALQIPFAVTYGNHDCQCGLSNAVQARFYETYNNFVAGEYRSDTDRGTTLIPLFSENGEKIYHICLFDSNGQNPDGAYAPVSPEQLQWYEQKCREEKEKTGQVLPQLVFQHIPVPEFYSVLQKVPRFTKGAVEAFRIHKNEFYALPDEMISRGDFMLESPAVPDENTGEFEVLKRVGAAKAISVGHDHNNSFVGEYRNVKLIYTQCAGFHVYGPHLNRGVRIFELDENNLTDFQTRTLTYQMLTDEKPSSPLAEFILTHIPTSLEQIKPLFGIAAAGTLALASGIAVVILRRKHR